MLRRRYDTPTQPFPVQIRPGVGENKADIPLSTKEDKESKALTFILNATRNLFIGLVVGVSLCSFSVRAEGLFTTPGSSAGGVISGVATGVAITLITVSALVHAYMVYRHNRLLGFSSMWWYVIPIGATLLICVPIIVYLAYLY